MDGFEETSVTEESSNIEKILASGLGEYSGEINPPLSRVEALLIKMIQQGGGGGEEAAAKEFNRFYGMCTKTTSIATVNGNKVITENDTGELVQTVTTISTVATGKQIVTVVTPTSGSYNYRKTVLIEKSNGTTTITESYVKEAK